MRQLVCFALCAAMALAAMPSRAQEARTIARACAGDIRAGEEVLRPSQRRPGARKRAT